MGGGYGEMNQKIEPDAASPPSPLFAAKPVPVEEFEDGVDSIREKILSGRALLRIVAYQWGVEFAVCEGKERQ
jgi:hypothetical protein